MCASTSVDKNEITSTFVDGIRAASLNKVNNVVTNGVTGRFSLACLEVRVILFLVSLSLAISIRASIMSMSMSSTATTKSTIIIKTKTTGASGEVRNS